LRISNVARVHMTATSSPHGRRPAWQGLSGSPKRRRPASGSGIDPTAVWSLDQAHRLEQVAGVRNETDAAWDRRSPANLFINNNVPADRLIQRPDGSWNQFRPPRRPAAASAIPRGTCHAGRRRGGNSSRSIWTRATLLIARRLASLTCCRRHAGTRRPSSGGVVLTPVALTFVGGTDDSGSAPSRRRPARSCGRLKLPSSVRDDADQRT